MNRSVCAITITLLAGTAMAQTEPKTRPQGVAPANASEATERATNIGAVSQTNADPTSRIVVHTDRLATDTRDARVDLGGMKISMPGTVISGTPVQTANGTSTPSAGAAIEVPPNTLGPGEPLWRISDRQDADRKLAEAEADIARAQAERSTRYGAWYGGYSGYGWFGGYAGYAQGSLWRHDGLRGPVTTTITRSDDLGSTAQRAFSESAYPRLNRTQDAHDRAVSQFGRDAAPPIVRIQNDVDRAHTNASKEHPEPPR